MASAPISWGSDCEVSMPEVYDSDPGADIDLGGGYLFTPAGLKHKFTAADREVFFTPSFAPLPSPEAATG